MSARLVDAIYDATRVNAGASPTLDLNYGGMMGVNERKISRRNIRRYES
nr:MAG TPA: hypothetical protein [Caudoviricetes sp.]